VYIAESYCDFLMYEVQQHSKKKNHKDTQVRDEALRICLQNQMGSHDASFQLNRSSPLRIIIPNPADSSGNIFSYVAESDLSLALFALGILDTRGNVNLGSEDRGLEVEAAFVGRVQFNVSRGVGRPAAEVQHGIDWGLGESYFERRVGSFGGDDELSAGGFGKECEVRFEGGV
jgi:hypothetical protein